MGSVPVGAYRVHARYIGYTPATVTVVEPMTALAIPHHEFQRLIDDDPTFARHLLRTLCARLREAEDRITG